MKRSILLVFAHPDDESFGLAGTVLKYTRQGVPVDLVCATRGEKGSPARYTRAHGHRHRPDG